MTGEQHAEIGLAAAVPAGVALATGALLPSLPLAPAWLTDPRQAVGGLLVAALVIGGGLLGALMPDLDTGRSMLEAAPMRTLRRLRRRRPWFIWLPAVAILLPLAGLLSLTNWLIMLGSHHRGVTHGLAALLFVPSVIWLLTTWALGPALALGLALGYASHLAADSLTPQGIELFAPWSRWDFHLLPRPLRFGGQTWQAGCLTHLLLVAGLAAAVWLVWRAIAG